MRKRIIGLLGGLGLIFPNFLLYFEIQHFFCPVGEMTSYLSAPGFFYTLGRVTCWGGDNKLFILWLSRQWVGSLRWIGAGGFFLYLISLIMAALGLSITLRNIRLGSFLLLLAGITTMGYMLVTFYHILDAKHYFFYFSVGIPMRDWTEIRVYPMPVGALFQLLVGLIGIKS